MTRYETFSEAKASGLFAEATRAGITRETFGQYHNSARRSEHLGDRAGEVRALRKCLEINDVWGSRWHEYGANADTITRIVDRLSELGE